MCILGRDWIKNGFSHQMRVWLCGVWMGLIPHPLSPCGRLGRRLKEITGRSWAGLHVLNLFSGRATEGGGNGKENVPFVRNRTPGGRKWAGGLWSWPPDSALRWPRRSIGARDGRERSQVPPWEPADRADLLGARRRRALPSYRCSDSRSQLAAS